MSEVVVPEWLKEKVVKNDQRFGEWDFKRLSYYYKQITGTPLKKGCMNCVPDAFIVLKIHLRKQGLI